MTIILRIALGILIVTQLVIGGWNQFWPEGFYRYFPTVDLTPPFSEHYARDFGGATLAMAVVLIAAFVWLDHRLVIVAGLSYLVFAVPHYAFHLHHLEHATLGQAVLLVTELGVSTLLGVLVLGLGVVRMRRDAALRNSALG